MPPLSITIPTGRHFRTGSRDKTSSKPHSRSTSVDSLASIDNGETIRMHHIQRWNGVTREATDWNALRRDPELYFPAGNCLIYLFTQGRSRRGPSFRMPYDFLLYSSCRPLIEQALLTSMQAPAYHPGSDTPPSYENVNDPSATEHTYLSLYLDAPAGIDRTGKFNYHITTRNFFAWLIGAPLVGKDPVSALIDLKARMDIWRDAGADNFGALQQYVQEQSYGDFEEMEVQMGRELDGQPVEERPQPYRNLGDIEVQPVPSLEMEDEPRRGRRASLSRSIRSTSSKLARRFSRSRTRKDDSDSDSSLGDRAAVPAPISRGRPSAPRTPVTTASPASMGPAPSPSIPLHKNNGKSKLSNSQNPSDPVPEKKLTKRASFVKGIKRRLSWAAGPLRPTDEPDPMPSGPPGGPGKGPGGPPPGMGPPPMPGMGPPKPPPDPTPYALRVSVPPTVRSLAAMSDDVPQSAPPLSMHPNFSRPNLGQSIQGSVAGSQASLVAHSHGTYTDLQGRDRCQCCGKLAKKRSSSVAPSSAVSFAGGPAGVGPSGSAAGSRRGSIQGSLVSVPGVVHPQGSSHGVAPAPPPVPHANALGAHPPRPPSIHAAVTSNSRRGSNAGYETGTFVSRPQVAPSTTQQNRDGEAEAQRTISERNEKETKNNRRSLSKEIFIPNYGNGTGGKNAPPPVHSSNVKGKQRETPSPLVISNASLIERGPPTGNSLNSSSGFSGLPELDFGQSRSASSLHSPDAAYSLGAERKGSRAPSVGRSSIGVGRPGSAAGSLYGEKSGMSFHNMVTKKRASDASVDGLIKELQMAGIAGEEDEGYVVVGNAKEMEDEDEMVGVGVPKTLGLRV